MKSRNYILRTKYTLKKQNAGMPVIKEFPSFAQHS